jgi:hypothetical protein
MFRDLVLGNDMVNSNGSGTGVDTAVYLLVILLIIISKVY